MKKHPDFKIIVSQNYQSRIQNQKPWPYIGLQVKFSTDLTSVIAGLQVHAGKHVDQLAGQRTNCINNLKKRQTETAES
jgi:hypothetical protein